MANIHVLDSTGEMPLMLEEMCLCIGEQFIYAISKVDLYEHARIELVEKGDGLTTTNIEATAIDILEKRKIVDGAVMISNATPYMIRCYQDDFEPKKNIILMKPLTE